MEKTPAIVRRDAPSLSVIPAQVGLQWLSRRTFAEG
jgi:hypothetical protein